MRRIRPHWSWILMAFAPHRLPSLHGFVAPTSCLSKHDIDCRHASSSSIVDDAHGCYGNSTVTDSRPSRRRFIALSVARTVGISSAAAAATSVAAPQHVAAAAEPLRQSITMPLLFTGRELLISYKVDKSRFRAVLDTGSPFLMVPGSCGINTQLKSGCYRNQGKPTGLDTTIEIFDGFEGEVEWRKGSFDFLNATDDTGQKGTIRSLLKQDDDDVIIFGVASEEIMTGPGGVFFGMIRDTDARIRPSFLGQTNVQAFRVNLQSRPRTLALSNLPLLDGAPAYIPMTNVLRRRYRDPVGHYTARAKSVVVNGYPLLEASSNIFVIFDTGVTGMIVSRGLFNEQYANARKRKQKSLFGNVTLTFDTKCQSSRKDLTPKAASLTAIKPITTPFDPEDQWKRFPKSSHIIVLGLAFLEDRVLTVDIDKERLWVD